MNEIVFNCDRCGNEVVGHYDEYFTAGYYDVGSGSAWHKFARDGEDRICDPCMFLDPLYQRVYSHDGEARAWLESHGHGLKSETKK